MTIRTFNKKIYARPSISVPVKKARITGKKSVNKIAGCLSSEDAAELKSIIENGCERIDENAWKNLH
jgi:hypothetical protein